VLEAECDEAWQKGSKARYSSEPQRIQSLSNTLGIRAWAPTALRSWRWRDDHPLDRAMVDRLRAMRGPGESYSDVILRLTAAPQ
jgi:hypothetical protein